jgi:hypothetical protein
MNSASNGLGTGLLTFSRHELHFFTSRFQPCGAGTIENDFSTRGVRLQSSGFSRLLEYARRRETLLIRTQHGQRNAVRQSKIALEETAVQDGFRDLERRRLLSTDRVTVTNNAVVKEQVRTTPVFPLQ